MKKNITLVFILCCLLLSGCSKAKDDSDGGNYERTSAVNNNELYGGDVADEALSAVDTSNSKGVELLASGSDLIIEERKIIKNAKLDASADDVQKSYKDILLWLNKNGGYEFNQSMTAKDDTVTLNAVLKIVPQKLDELLTVIGEKTDIINLNVSSNDITDDYLDTALRLRAKEAALEEYYSLLEDTTDFNYKMSIMQTIESYTADIEAMKGKLNFWDAQVSESTVTLYIWQTNDPEKPEPEPEPEPDPVGFNAMSFSSMTRRLGNGFMSVLNVICGFLQWVLIIVVSTLPAAIPIAIIVVVFIHFKKKQNKSLPPEDNTINETFLEEFVNKEDDNK